MQNNNADLTNPVSAQEAQAKDSPGLSSVLEEMENGVDIQPLNDIVQSEYIEFNDNAVYENDEINETESSKNKKNSRIKKFARSALFVVLSVCLLVTCRVSCQVIAHPGITIRVSIVCLATNLTIESCNSHIHIVL